MSRRWLLFLVCLGCSLPFISETTNARFELRVNEAATRIFLKELAPEVSLVVENGSKDIQRVRVRLELLAPNQTVSAATERKVDLRTGSQNLPFTLPFKTRDLTPDEEDEILWYRLHYQITPATSNDSVAEGIISLSEITPDLFELRVIGPRKATQGKLFSPRVRATHPITRQPLKDVQVKGMITISDDKDVVTLISSALTNSEGFADLNFKLPDNLDDDEFELEIEGSHGLVTVKAEHDIETYSKPYLLVSVDKPLYQPGQTVYARLLMLSPSKHALANKEVEFRVTDPEGTVVANSTLETSRFGVASAEWSIPSTTRLGDYELEFSTDDHDYSVDARVQVSRYDLPTFSVKAKTDRPYYLPGQNASVEIKADYLFGKPVGKGHVRLVRESERSWNYAEQKYDITEGDKYEGDTEANGIFKAQLELSEDHQKLAGENYNRFTDLPYTAYFTDPSTKRTEQRRFNIRVTKDAIHIYVIRPRDSYQENRKLPLRFYVSTSYADGTPAPSNLTLRLADPNPARHNILIKAKTNRYGLVTIDQLRLPPTELELQAVDLELSAQDKDGKTGHHTEGFSLSDDPAIQITSNKVLLSKGEPIEATIKSTEPDERLIVNVTREGTLVHSEDLKLKNGQASLFIPYQTEFTGELTITAYADLKNDESEYDLVWGARTVRYPRKRLLNVNVDSAPTYKPGERAHVRFSSIGPEGKGVESALGVVVTDRAVDERVRIDQGESSRYASFSNDVSALLGRGDLVTSLTGKSLEQFDLTKPIPSDLSLAAEVMLNQGHNFDTIVFGGDNYDTDPPSVFRSLIEEQLKPFVIALKKNYELAKTYPRTEQSLQKLSRNAGLDFLALRDPWGLPYRATFFTDHQLDMCAIKSAGPDKHFDTDDDFEVSRLSWNYFQQIGEAIDLVVQDYHRRTGKYIHTYQTLRDEIRSRKIDLDTLRDPWNRAYKFIFNVSQTNIQVQATSVDSSDQPFTLFVSSIDYFAEDRWNIDVTLEKRLKETGKYPGNETELHEALLTAGIDTKKLSDPWGHSYYYVFQTQSLYGDRVEIESQSVYGQPKTDKLRVTPVTRTITVIKIRSTGADAQKDTEDDFEVGTFAATLLEQSATDAKPRTDRSLVSFSGSTGAITGTIIDPVGAAISSAHVTARAQNSNQVFEATVDDNGKYLIRNLPVGIYEVRVSASGFKDSVVSQVVIRSSTLIQINFTLEVGTISEVVTVTGGHVEALNIMSASVSTSVTVNRLILLAPGIAAAKQQLATPRVREYFPETLLWQPQLTTDKKGRAQLDFKLADNITTWRMSVIGSTEDGEIGTAETEIRAFQPFFAELDPPRVLTEGDRISLPVVLRNYLEKKQSVAVVLKPESWFKLLDSNQKRAEIPAGESRNEVFDLQTVASTKDGKQQISALGSDFSDAIEKPVTVHPDGEERFETSSDLLDRTTSLAVNLPANVIPNSNHVDVKIYPNLMTHVWESVEAILKRPYGCGEQTISSTYPSLMVLRYLGSQKSDSAVAIKARKYLESGYQRLLGYQSPSGGFTYWGHGDPDVALTAYAIRFLHDASTVMDIGKGPSLNARRWLISQQRDDGSWAASNWDKSEDRRRTATLTALAARSLALIESAQKAGASPVDKTPLIKALDYLESRTSGFEDPYLIASYSLASNLAGFRDRAERANSRLQQLAKPQGSKTYWELETNTPFYGWGLAGLIETTALAVQALTNGGDLRPEVNNVRSRGLLFLLQNKDQYGVWHSTQATVNVLDAMLAILANKNSPQQTEMAPAVEIFVNDKPAGKVALPANTRDSAPLYFDITSFVGPGANRVEFRRAGAGSPISLQVVNTYYVPWTSAEDVVVKSGHAQALKLETKFDKQSTQIGEEITCNVKAERIGFHGFGMLLAEIGLPPGADVDRASLETAIRGSDSSVSQYDVLPDRVVVYLWPKAGGSEFSFKFRPRIAMTAKAAPSSIYDYYNPEAKALVAPGTFVVK